MITVPAPWRDTPGPTWPLLAAMLRNQCRQFSESPGQVQQGYLELSALSPSWRVNSFQTDRPHTSVWSSC